MDLHASGLPTFEEAYCALCGFGGAVLHNWFQKRPLFSKKPFLGVVTLGGAILGHYLSIYMQNKNTKKQLYLLDYVDKHPERFPEPPRRKYAEVFEEWYPQR